MYRILIDRCQQQESNFATLMHRILLLIILTTFSDVTDGSLRPVPLITIVPRPRGALAARRSSADIFLASVSSGNHQHMTHYIYQCTC